MRFWDQINPYHPKISMLTMKTYKQQTLFQTSTKPMELNCTKLHMPQNIKTQFSQFVHF